MLEKKSKYVGMPFKEGTFLALKDGYVTRVVSKDGEDLTVTLDFNPKRVNFVVERDRITEAYVA